MNPIANFLTSGKRCPCCDTPLTFHFQFEHSVCLEGGVPCKVGGVYQDPYGSLIQEVPSEITFTAAYNCGNSSYPASQRFDTTDKIIMTFDKDNLSMSPGSDKIRKLLAEKRFYLFALCNTRSIKVENADYNISAYNVCYHKSSAFCHLSNGEVIVNDIKSDIIKYETFSFHNYIESTEKTYILSFDYYENHSKFYYFIATEEQRQDSNFRPRILEKELPMLNGRPDFSKEARDKLFKKFDSWVLMS